MNKTNNKKIHIIYGSIIAVLIVAILTVLFLNPLNNNNTTNKDINSSDGTFVPSLTTNKVDKIKETATEVDKYEDKTVYTVQGDFDNLGIEGNYTYHINEKDEIIYSDYRIDVFKYDLRLAYDDLTNEEKEEIITEGYKKITPTLEYFTKNLKYKILSIRRVPFDTNEETSIVDSLPSIDVLKQEFSYKNQIVYCYIIEFETPEKEMVSVTISTEGLNSISFIVMKN